ncbi:uncharacterized protein [Prorops nasuta]|uniref:uncharacterized protein n=1 Tax=Prorops nasuta TaxID=863751 RepID=UPI0034CF3667
MRIYYVCIIYRKGTSNNEWKFERFGLGDQFRDNWQVIVKKNLVADKHGIFLQAQRVPKHVALFNWSDETPQCPEVHGLYGVFRGWPGTTERIDGASIRTSRHPHVETSTRYQPPPRLTIPSISSHHNPLHCVLSLFLLLRYSSFLPFSNYSYCYQSLIKIISCFSTLYLILIKNCIYFHYQ